MAVTREVASSLGDCQLSFVPRQRIDLARARKQHADYCRALEAMGCKVVVLPAEDTMPDSVFVEDAALVLDEVAVMTRPGAPARQAEGASLQPVLASFRPLLQVNAPAMLDGGDVLRIGRDLYIGQAARSNPAGVAQLRELLAPFGYRVHGVPTRDCLHLKSAVTMVADDALLVQPRWVDPGAFPGLHLIEVDPGEPHAANALRIGENVLHPANFPRTTRRLRDAGIGVTTVDVSELQKAEGATTCCSLVFREELEGVAQVGGGGLPAVAISA